MKSECHKILELFKQLTDQDQRGEEWRGAFGAETFASLLGLGVQTVHNRLEELLDNGYLKRELNNLYRLTDET